MHWYTDVLKRYADFNGRARRREYWFFNLFNFLILCALFIVEMMLGLGSDSGGIGLLSGLYAVGVLVPGIAVSVRRLHDTGRSGWWCLVALIPFIGPLILLVFMVFDSQPGANQYGPNPKGT